MATLAADKESRHSGPHVCIVLQPLEAPTSVVFTECPDMCPSCGKGCQKTAGHRGPHHCLEGHDW